jgi:hypothetical protein
MLRLLADENFNGDVVRALLLRQPDLDIVRVQDVGLAGIADPDILAWAAVNDRIILTHDRATLPNFSSWMIDFLSGTRPMNYCCSLRAASNRNGVPRGPSTFMKE